MAQNTKLRRLTTYEVVALVKRTTKHEFHPVTVRRWHNAGVGGHKLPAKRLSGHLSFARSEVLAFLDAIHDHLPALKSFSERRRSTR